MRGRPSNHDMQQSQTYITANELYQRAAQILEAGSQEGALVNKMLHETLVMACAAGLRNTSYSFGDLNARVDHLCTQRGLSAADTRAIHQMRRHSNSSSPILPEDLTYDVRALCVFISAVFREVIPSFLVGKIPVRAQQTRQTLRLDERYICCIVRQWDEHYIWVMPDGETDERLLQVEYTSEEQFADLSYLHDILREGMPLNLLDCQVKDHLVTPRRIIVIPDYLVDISSLATCFTEYGHHPALFTINRMKDKANTRHTILGNFAGSALDDIIHARGECAFNMAETLKDNFREKALEYCTCTDLDPVAFKVEAMKQVQNLQQIVAELFKTYNRERALLEPSFVCEQLGIQGRVDMMTTDFRLLVEQKSGKNMNLEYGSHNRHGNQHVEAHYVQALLYYGVLRYNFRLSDKATRIFLLYSKYALPTGLMDVSRLDMLIHEALKLRNLIVAADYTSTLEGFEGMLPQLNPQTLNTENTNTYFYNRFLLPQIEAITVPLEQMSKLEKAYFCRMMTFVLKEQLISKTGGVDGSGRSSADLWNMPLSEKKEMGNIYTGLTITQKKRTRSRGFDEITLAVPDQGEDFLPNFRRGDMVYLYGYHPDSEPDVRRSILFKGFIMYVKTDEIAVHLTDAQQNDDLLYTVEEGKRHAHHTPLVYAVEHSASDAGGSSAIHALHTLMTTSKERRDLLLGQREPRANHALTLSRSYHPDYDDVVLKAKQAQDYFLLVGPPGTGKTSMALRYMVLEELENPDANILLMAYTNRAVDEICGMLCDEGLDFIRLGNEYSCDPRFKSHLLGQTIDDHPKLNDLRQRFASMRLIVSTTSMMMSKPFIFAIKHFSLALIDEASQILEPNLVGILSSHVSTTGGSGLALDHQPNIDKFILIGDYKQLPAVVQQDASESQVTDADLQNICLTDCRNSLFERLIRWEERQGRTDFVDTLRKQGRMHPVIAAFPNKMFYAKEQLQPVPLPHQVGEDIGYTAVPQDETDALLVSHRLLYYPSHFTKNVRLSDKVNPDEARKVADLLRRIHRLAKEKFDVQKTVGVIVPYRNQIAMVRKEIEKTGISQLMQVDVDTVERYQGSQRDVIIYSFTVQNRYQLDFLTANSFLEGHAWIDRKLNVALTRARKQLIVLGNEEVLSANPLFKLLIDDIPVRLC